MTAEEKALGFLKNLDMHPEYIRLEETTDAFLEHMRRGLVGKDSSIKMLPAYLTGEGSIAKNTPVAVIDAGGTNFRTAVVTFTENGPVIEKMAACPVPGADKAVTWGEFIRESAEIALPAVKRAESIGFCFSYPAEITPECDGRVICFTKQLRVSGAEGKAVGGGLVSSLEERGAFPKKCVVLNDTVAALLGGAAMLRNKKYGGFAGLIYGTGLNTACSIPAGRIAKLESPFAGNMLVNMETGGFCGMERGKIDALMDAALPDRGEYLHEKMASGAYLGELVRLTLIKAREDGVFRGKPCKAEHLTAREADDFCREPCGENPLAKLCTTDADREFVYTTIKCYIDRAARLICSCLSAMLLLTGDGRDTSRPACIVAEGSTFYKNSLFRPQLDRYMSEFTESRLKRYAVFEKVEGVNLIGAAAAALLN